MNASFGCVRFGLLSTGQEVRCVERLGNYLFSVKWDVKPYSYSNSLVFPLFHFYFHLPAVPLNPFGGMLQAPSVVMRQTAAGTEFDTF